MWEMALLALGGMFAVLQMGPGGRGGGWPRGGGGGMGGRRGGGPPGGGPGGRPGGGPPGGGARGKGLGMLLRNSSVRDELDLTDDQIAEMREILTEVRGRFRDQMQTVRQLTGTEKTEKGKELGKSLSQEVHKGLRNLFTLEQQKRLRQIELQVMGMEVFNDAEVHAALHLNDAQKEQFKTLAETARKEVQQSIREAREGKQGDAKGKIGALRRQASDKVVDAVLTAEQKKIWVDLLGAPFELVIEAPPQMGPQGGPGGPGGSGGPRGGRGQGGPFSLDFDDI